MKKKRPSSLCNTTSTYRQQNNRQQHHTHIYAHTVQSFDCVYSHTYAYTQIITPIHTCMCMHRSQMSTFSLLDPPKKKPVGLYGKIHLSFGFSANNSDFIWISKFKEVGRVRWLFYFSVQALKQKPKFHFIFFYFYFKFSFQN